MASFNILTTNFKTAKKYDSSIGTSQIETNVFFLKLCDNQKYFIVQDEIFV